MGRPVIGVAWPKPDYVAALERAGAEVRVISPDSHPLPSPLDECDGLLLTGGADVEPARFGAHALHPTVKFDRARDDYELPLAQGAIARGLPILAICRGMQLLNVAAGGTLVQDIPSECPMALAHAIDHITDATVHDVEVRAGSRLAAVLGDALDAQHRVPVNSRHHQAVKDVAPGFIVAATAPDDIVEAIEAPQADFCVAVQWHPENFWQTGQFATLFEGLVEAARRRRR